MKKTERYFYPAVFTYEPEQEIAVTFPDLDAATSGENEDDAPANYSAVFSMAWKRTEKKFLRLRRFHWLTHKATNALYWLTYTCLPSVWLK